MTPSKMVTVAGERPRVSSSISRSRVGQDQGLSARQHLLLAARELAGALQASFGQAGECVVDLPDRLRQTGRVPTDGPAHEAQVLLDAQRWEHAMTPLHSDDPQLEAALGREIGDVLSIEGDPTTGGGGDPGQHP